MGQFDRRIERAAVLVLGFGVFVSVNGFLDALFGDGNVKEVVEGFAVTLVACVDFGQT